MWIYKSETNREKACENDGVANTRENKICKHKYIYTERISD